jgi:hypothetical protein
MNKLVVGIDFDNVLADFMRLYRLAVAFHENREEEIPEDEITEWEWPYRWGRERFENFCRISHQRGWILCIPPLIRTDILSAVLIGCKHLLRSKYDLVFFKIVSHQYDKPWRSEIFEWLVFHNLEELIDKIDVVESPEQKLKTDLNWLIDDNYETCSKAAEIGIKTVVIRKPWNEKFERENQQLLWADDILQALPLVCKEELRHGYK